MRVRDEPPRDNAGRPGTLGNLKLAVRFLAERPVQPRSIERQTHFLARGSGGDVRLEMTSGAQDAPSERSQRNSVGGARRLDILDHPSRELWIVGLQLDDERHARIP